MNFKTTGVLLGLVALGLVLWYVAGDKPAGPVRPQGLPPDATEVKMAIDPPVNPADVVRLEIERPGQPKLVFAQQQAGSGGLATWALVEPVAAEAEVSAVRGLVNTIARLKRRETYKPGELSADEAGLAEPQARYTLVTNEDGKEQAHTLEIGKRAPLSTQHFARMAGDETIILLDRDLERELKQAVKDFRAKTLARVGTNDAVELRVSVSDKSYAFKKNDAGQWVMTQPVKAYADDAKIRSLINQVNLVRAEDFVADAPENLAAYGLADPYLRVSVTTEAPPPAMDVSGGEDAATQPAPEPERATTTLMIGGYADLQNKTRYAKLGDQANVVTVPDSAVQNLVPNASELRSPELTRISGSTVTEMVLRSGGREVTLTRADGRWQAEGAINEVDLAAVQDLLQVLEDTRAVDYIDNPEDLSKYGLTEPRATIAVTTEGAVEPLTIEVGSPTPSGANTYVHVAGQASVAVASSALADRLALRPLDLRSREIFALGDGEFTRIVLERGKQTFVLERDEGGLKLTQPAEASASAAAVREITTDLARLRARRIVAEGELARYGLDKPTTVIRFDSEKPPAEVDVGPVRPEAASHELRIAQVGETIYAALDDEPYVFELDPTVYRVLTQEVIDPALFSIKSDAVAGMVIEAPGGRLEFEKVDGEWTFPTDPTVKLAQKSVQELANLLAGLRVERYLEYGDADIEAAGFEESPATVTIRLTSGPDITLKIDQAVRGELPRLGAWVENRTTFLLRQADVEKLLRGLAAYLPPVSPPKES